MTRDEALAIAADLVLTESATPEEIADELMKAWDEGYAVGDQEGYERGYDAAREPLDSEDEG